MAVDHDAGRDRGGEAHREERHMSRRGCRFRCSATTLVVIGMMSIITASVSMTSPIENETRNLRADLRPVDVSSDDAEIDHDQRDEGVTLEETKNSRRWARPRASTASGTGRRH